jgi:1-aminocyclopropane-1-carboxylate deaminase/D-cysteine desulfhydrase-like pyridoxal-dependent ACC family enzyme
MTEHNNESIRKLIEGFPRANLIQTPAIIHKLPRLSKHLEKPVYILREDLTGFALGGNKTRKVDYLFGDAIAKKADTLVTIKATSFSRNAAVAASACGLDLHVVLAGTESEHNPASQFIFHQCGTKLYYVSEGGGSVEDTYTDLVRSLKMKGKVVYELHPGGSDAIGALSYVYIFGELVDFSYRSKIHFSQIIHSTSSAGTQAGLVLGQCISTYDTKIIGVTAALEAGLQYERIRKLAQETAQMLGTEFDETKIIVDDGFVGPGYAMPSEEGEYATKLFATLEGVLLDQVYSGKAASALLHYAKNKVHKGDNILFIHTGGNSGLYY